jgi:hypothetical protein
MEEYKFPDENNSVQAIKPNDEDIEVEIVDDTP